MSTERRCFFSVGNRFKISDNANFFPVGDTSLDAAGAIAQVVKTAILSVICNFVVRLRASIVGNADALSNLNCLNSIDAHNSLG
jgi:hypothetical protein